MKTVSRLFLWAGIITAFFQCSPDRIGSLAGGGSGTETVGGCAVDSEQKPAAHIKVIVRRSDFLDTGNISVINNQDVFKADTTTDADGRFSLLIGVTGTYTFDLYDDKKGNAVFERCTVKQDDSLYVLTTLKETGEFSGRINQAPEADQTRFTIYFYGFARHSVMTEDSGKFSVPHLAPGEYRFKVIPQTPIYASYEGSVTIVSGETTYLPPIDMQKADFKFHPSDSLAVRAILDSNGLQAIPVDSIARADAAWPHRIVGLVINNLVRNNLYFRMLTSKIGDLTELRTMNVSHNVMMTRLPKDIGKLKHLSELVLKNNGISIIPQEIGDLASLKVLDISENTNSGSPVTVVIPAEIGNLDLLEILIVQNNNITELPPEIGICRSLKKIDVSICKLKTLPAELAACKNLEFINAATNRIDSLPVAITQLGSTANEHNFINLKDNKFCLRVTGQIPQIIFDWLDKYSISSKWRDDQTCQGICVSSSEQP